MSRNALVLCVLIFGWDMANTRLGTFDPAVVFCGEMGYAVEGADCVFPDGRSCELGAFLGAQCGEDYVHPVSCAEAGKRRGVAMACCEDLAEIANTFSFEKTCVQLGGSSLCSACGDETCDGWENPCNCPEDCPACVGEGERALPNAAPPPCCAGLTLIPPRSRDSVGIHGYCTEFCGDGTCDPAVETSFNCPADCRQMKRFNRRRPESPWETRLTSVPLPPHLRNLAALLRVGRPVAAGRPSRPDVASAPRLSDSPAPARGR